MYVSYKRVQYSRTVVLFINKIASEYDTMSIRRVNNTPLSPLLPRQQGYKIST